MSVLGEPARTPEVIRIQPTKGWVSLRLHELWEYRELLYFLTWRDLKVRYKQTALGATWAILQPVLTMVVFTLVLSKAAGKTTTGGLPYPLFSFSGLLPFTFFQYGLTNAANSMTSNVAFITKVYFPRLAIPLAPVFSGLADFLLAGLVMAGLMAWYGYAPPLRIVVVLPLLVLAGATALGVGLWLAALNVRYRDVRYVVPFLGQLWLFASDIAYPVAPTLSQPWRTLYELNPMVGVVDGFRWGVLGSNAVSPVVPVLLGTVVAALLLVSGMFYFRRTERTFADVA